MKGLLLFAVWFIQLIRKGMFAGHTAADGIFALEVKALFYFAGTQVF